MQFRPSDDFKEERMRGIWFQAPPHPHPNWHELTYEWICNQLSSIGYLQAFKSTCRFELILKSDMTNYFMIMAFTPHQMQ
jgi:hypothetical protein